MILLKKEEIQHRLYNLPYKLDGTHQLQKE